MNAWFLNQLQPSCSCPQWRRLPFRRRDSTYGNDASDSVSSTKARGGSRFHREEAPIPGSIFNPGFPQAG